MEVLHPHCAGLDVHKESVVACIRHMVDGKVTTDVKTFKTTTQELIKREFPRLCRGGSSSLTFAGVGPMLLQFYKSSAAWRLDVLLLPLLLLFTGCDQAPLRGQQP